MFKKLQNRLNNIAGKALLNTLQNTQHGQLLQIQVANGDTRENVLAVQPYGTASHAPKTATPLWLANGGTKQKTIVYALHDPDAPLPENQGDTVQYSIHGTRIWHTAKGLRLVPGKGQKIILDADVEISGKLTVAKDIRSLLGDVVAGVISLIKHKHDPNSGQAL